MPETLLPVDLDAPPTDQPAPLHNRWHPEIPPVATVKPGDTFRVDCREWFDGAIVNDDSAEDILLGSAGGLVGITFASVLAALRRGG